MTIKRQCVFCGELQNPENLSEDEFEFVPLEGSMYKRVFNYEGEHVPSVCKGCMERKLMGDEYASTIIFYVGKYSNQAAIITSGINKTEVACSHYWDEFTGYKQGNEIDEIVEEYLNGDFEKEWSTKDNIEVKTNRPDSILNLDIDGEYIVTTGSGITKVYVRNN